MRNSSNVAFKRLLRRCPTGPRPADTFGGGTIIATFDLTTENVFDAFKMFLKIARVISWLPPLDCGTCVPYFLVLRSMNTVTLKHYDNRIHQQIGSLHNRWSKMHWIIMRSSNFYDAWHIIHQCFVKPGYDIFVYMQILHYNTVIKSDIASY